MAETADPTPDFVLLERCHQHDQAAWYALGDRHERAVRKRVRTLLHARSTDDPLVDEVSLEAFEALATPDDGRLRAYDPGRGSFRTYLCSIARQIVCNRYRALLRHREVPLEEADEEADRDAGPTIESLLGELLPGLTSQQGRLCELCLRPNAGEELRRMFSPTNFRKTCQCVRQGPRPPPRRLRRPGRHALVATLRVRALVPMLRVAARHDRAPGRFPPVPPGCGTAGHRPGSRIDGGEPGEVLTRPAHSRPAIMAEEATGYRSLSKVNCRGRRAAR